MITAKIRPGLPRNGKNRFFVLLYREGEKMEFCRVYGGETYESAEIMRKAYLNAYRQSGSTILQGK